MADEKQNEELQIPIEWDYEKFKNSAEFKDIKRNKKGQFVPNNEQLKMLVKYEEIKLNEIDTSKVTDMSFLFCADTKLPTATQNNSWKVSKPIPIQLKDIGNLHRKDFSGINEWDTSKVTNFEFMFYCAENFNEDISGWDTSSAKSFRRMFSCTQRFNQPIGKWNTSSVTDMRCMFNGASSFNQDINSWDISKVEHSEDMFVSAKNFNQRLEKWDDSNIYNTSPIKFQEIKHKNGKFLPNNKQLKLLIYYGHIYYGKVKLDEIDTSEVTDMSNLFSHRTNQDFSGISEWDTSKVETFEKMFYENTKFNEDISSWDTSSAKNFRYMFYHSSQFNQPIGKWNTSNVTDMRGMFYLALKFNQPLDKWDTSSVTNMRNMFFCTNFNQNINDWDVSKVTDFSYMFSGMVGGRDKRFTDFNQPLDKWDVSSAKYMSGMFRYAKDFKQDLSAWGDKLGNLQDMREMFSGVGEDDEDNEDDTNTQSNKTKKPFYGIGEEALEKINCLESWTVPKDCKIIELECNLDDKELKKIVESLKKQDNIKELVEKIKSLIMANPKPNFSEKMLYEKLTNPQYIQYIAQMRMLEKALKTPKTRVGSFYGLNVSISILKDSEKIYKKEWENAEFLNDRQWIPENIQRHFRVFLEKNGKKGEINTWNTAYCEIFGLCFKIERYENERYKNEREERERERDEERERDGDVGQIKVGDYNIIQSYEIDDFNGVDENKFEEIDDDMSIYFTIRDIYIWHKESTNENDNRVFDIVLAKVLAEAYFKEMEEFSKARIPPTEYKALYDYHKKICEFDLNAYNNMPVLSKANDYEILKTIWNKISETRGVREMHDELKEAIAQMSQLLTDYKRDRQSWWFSLAAVLIALVSLLVAVVSALPVVEKLLE